MNKYLNFPNRKKINVARFARNCCNTSLLEWNHFENGQSSWYFNFHLVVSQKSLSKVQGLIEIRSDKWWSLLKSQVVNFYPTFINEIFCFVSGKKNFSICLYADSNRCQIGFSAKRSRNFFCQDFFMKNIITTRGNLTMQILVSSWVSCKYSWDFFLLLTKVLPKNRADLRVVGGQKISFLDHDLLRWDFL